jgi:hypothetical protein
MSAIDAESWRACIGSVSDGGRTMGNLCDRVTNGQYRSVCDVPSNLPLYPALYPYLVTFAPCICEDV